MLGGTAQLFNTQANKYKNLGYSGVKVSPGGEVPKGKTLIGTEYIPATTYQRNRPARPAQTLYIYGDTQQQAAPAAASPAPSSPSPQQVQLTAESQKYREEADAKLAEAQKLLDDFKIEQNKAAEAKKLQEQMAIRAQGTLASNLAMSQRKPSLQLSPASQTPQTAGTQPFKRRRLQVMTPGSQVTSGLNIGSANLLNV